MNKRVAIVLGVVVALIAGVVILLASGGPVDSDGAPEPGAAAEASGDVVVAEGPEPPSETELADIVEADVRKNGQSYVFRARMADRIPPRVKGGGMSWRWDIYEAGAGTWILSSNLDIGPVTSLTSTQSNYGSSTFDDSFPGTMSVEGTLLKITVRPKDLEDWPENFEWVLGTMLDGAQGNPRSALATDTAPDEGRGSLEG
jgi:hypothetical protein